MQAATAARLTVKAAYSETVQPNSKPTIPASLPVKKVTASKGWYTAKTDGKLYNTVTSITASTTFYAQFEANKYTVTWDLGTGQSETTEQTYGEKLLLPKDPERKNAEIFRLGRPDWTKPFRSAAPPQRSWKAPQKQARSRPCAMGPSAVPLRRGCQCRNRGRPSTEEDSSCAARHPCDPAAAVPVMSTRFGGTAKPPASHS